MSELDEKEQAIPQTEDEATELLESIEKPEETTEETPKAASPAPQEYSFKFGGKEIKAPIEKILTWASQGYGAPNKIGELNKQLEEWKAKEAQIKEIQDRYGVVDEYVKTNPDWWQYVMSEYQKRTQQPGQDMTSNPMLQELKKEIQDLKSYKETQEKMRQEQELQQNMNAYMEELEGMKKQYKQIDFDTPDEEGKNLEWKILEYAKENGIKNFKTAFRDFYHDELIKIEAEKAKENVIKDRSQKSKIGILGISSTPAKKTTDSVKGKSYKQLEMEALQELGLT